MNLKPSENMTCYFCLLTVTSLPFLSYWFKESGDSTPMVQFAGIWQSGRVGYTKKHIFHGNKHHYAAFYLGISEQIISK